jgi:small-conductance mechanosensitive channel
VEQAVAADRVPKPGEVSDDEAVQSALREVQSPKSTARAGHSSGRFGFVLYLAGFILLLVLYVLLDAGPTAGGTATGSAAPWLRKLTLGAMAMVGIIAVARTIEATVISRLASAASRYHLTQVLRLAAAVLVGVSIISLLSADWYTTLASLGVVSVILGLALQTPITSFFGWIYILVRAPYRVGDRIRIGDATGDVIGVSYLDTTLWEFGGPYLSTDHPSGRIIKFPNSKVLDSTVYNYSWPLFPFIWNEIRFKLAYGSDLAFVAETIQAVAEAEIGEQMMGRVRTYRQLLAETPIDQLTVQERPAVIFRPTDSWIEAILRYVVHPKETGRVRSQLTLRLLARLNEEPERVQFPYGNWR